MGRETAGQRGGRGTSGRLLCQRTRLICTTQGPGIPLTEIVVKVHYAFHRSEFLDVNVPSARSAFPKGVPSATGLSDLVTLPRLSRPNRENLSKTVTPSSFGTNIAQIWVWVESPDRSFVTNRL